MRTLLTEDEKKARKKIANKKYRDRIKAERALKKEKHTAATKRWIEENRDKWNSYQNEYAKQRRKIDPAYKARLSASDKKYRERIKVEKARIEENRNIRIEALENRLATVEAEFRKVRKIDLLLFGNNYEDRINHLKAQIVKLKNE